MQPNSIISGYRGRVRSGCLTCRSRKVKCDEKRSSCQNCTKVKRNCVYKPRKSTIPLSPSNGAEPYSSERRFSSYRERQPRQQSNENTRSSGSVGYDPFLSPDRSTGVVTSVAGIAGEGAANLPSAFIARDIELTTTMDLLAACDESVQVSLSFFLNCVDCPSITSFDPVNWKLMKFHIVTLGSSCSAVALAIVALSMLYKAQLYTLPAERALAHYRSAVSSIQELVSNDHQDFSTILVAFFLVCVYEMIYSGEVIPILNKPSTQFMQRLTAWTQDTSPKSDVSLKLIKWYRLLYANTLRGGGTRLISHTIYALLPSSFTPSSKLLSLHVPSPHPSDDLYDVLSAPIIDFYFRLQAISGDIAQQTHYHRSRTSSADQDEETRSGTQRQTPTGLRSNLAPEIAEPLISLISLCTAAYHAEFIELDRVLGDPVSKYTDSRQAMTKLEEIVNGDSNAFSKGKLNAGYLRPLFLYAIESTDQRQNEWAVGRLRQIQNPICRSEFFASFAEALFEAQMKKQRRVTSKYFCLRYFGVVPPFM
ncbi:hypothetical protein BJY04DRAFT_224499 [Aspergillus karnatakaensis]|uniref:Zn(II)2Cys6 transcription factor domain-containing protein n=1 Tax=Aspergillus karnatakaensis TaxID=1810916 RepID=UPI003CCD8EAF